MSVPRQRQGDFKHDSNVDRRLARDAESLTRPVWRAAKGPGRHGPGLRV